MLALILWLGPLAYAQQQPSSDNDMPGMDMSSMQHDHSSMNMQSKPDMLMMRQPTNLIESQLNHLSSGTSSEPASTPIYMMMGHHGAWMWMLHGETFVSDIQQQAAQTSTGRRGGDKLFSANWIMPMAMRRVGPGQLTVRAMFSLSPRPSPRANTLCSSSRARLHSANPSSTASIRTTSSWRSPHSMTSSSASARC
jgi:hypothetical protein